MEIILKQIEMLLSPEIDAVANMANTAAVIFNSLPRLNWAGFYILKGDKLVLGPFQGKPACVRISLGKGVCGVSARERKTLVVSDVHEFPGHIACDSASQSEIVVPIIKNGTLFGVLDIDSPIKNRFSDEDRIFFEKVVGLFSKYSDI
ncbi:Putative GAF sensor protein [Elusimicrobium minutum Pei191]|uniref:Putative GAF sensor protein n=1 Tax=Elusimicrobium minutum (strain Pei191) TaxID=445932 RepID=B2KAW7_ELUMP|nr:GAF domain-containing protein [Elusimicrobium minutum]ACC97663.1 Putative GAF sensor protein [Elusimicrobium minutum Pei191]